VGLGDSLMRHDIAFCSLYLSNPNLFRTWIKYHHSIGVNHFYLFTLGKELDYMIKPLEDLSDIVTIINWDIDIGPGGIFGYWAESCMTYYMGMIGVGEFEWVGNICPDEFLVLEKDNTVRNFLDRYKDKKYIKLKWNYVKMEGMTYDEYLNFDLNNFFKYDIKIQKYLRRENGEELDNPMSSGYGKYLFKPQYEINVGSVHNPIENPLYRYGTVEEGEYDLVDEKIGSLYHIRDDKSNTKLPRGFDQNYFISKNIPIRKRPRPDYLERTINWVLEDKGNLIINNRIRELIEENKND
jgi:hypothetical protein